MEKFVIAMYRLRPIQKYAYTSSNQYCSQYQRRRSALKSGVSTSSKRSYFSLRFWIDHWAWNIHSRMQPCRSRCWACPRSLNSRTLWLTIISAFPSTQLSRTEMEMVQWVMGHGSNGSPFLDGSRGSWVTASDPLTHDEITQYHYQTTYFCFPLRLATI